MALPIEACLNDILQKLESASRLVIQAPPGAGKTTLVPLALLRDSGAQGRVLLIQPRRLAVYGAAWRMAALLNEKPGDTIAYTTRYDRKKSPESRIEVVTEGIFLRMLQSDPELSGVDTVIFDEFHERSVTNDLALAFTLESQQGFRDSDAPLKLIVMSATLDGEKLSQWLDAPLVRSEGRMFPVTTCYKPKPAQLPIERHIAALILNALREENGSLLVFLPGMKAINRVAEQLENQTLPADTDIHKLHSALPHDQQQAAISAPAANKRKVVLTTNVAETSITIEGIRVVIDSGLERHSRYNERKGMNVLVTEKISAASAEQRRGRAGRLTEGVCYRAWSKTEQTQLKAFSDPEILHTDLLPVALELAIWGCTQPNDLMLLTQPDEKALSRAIETLRDMNAVHDNGLITTLGQQMAAMGLHPRLALLIATSQTSAQMAAVATAAILSEGDPLRFHQQWPQSDLRLRLGLWQSSKSVGDLHRGTWQRAQQLARQLAQRANCDWQAANADNPDVAEALAHAFPDRVAQLRKHTHHRYLMANGKGVQLNPEDQLAGSRYLIILDASGNDKEPYIRLACFITESQLENALSDHFTQTNTVRWHQEKQAVESITSTCLHHLVINQITFEPKDPDALPRCLLEGIRETGIECLPWDSAADHIRQRINWLHQQSPSTWPDWSNNKLEKTLEEWLLPYVTGMRRLADLKRLNLAEILRGQLSWERQTKLETQAPAQWRLPTGNERKVEYDEKKGPVLRAKMQELYGIQQHPVIEKGVPLLVEILSPANRPVQITRDLPGFWKGSYQEVAREMRGRYPKHYWPEAPDVAQATNKTKRHL